MNKPNNVYNIALRQYFVDKILSGQKKTLIRPNGLLIRKGDVLNFFVPCAERAPQFLTTVQVAAVPIPITIDSSQLCYNQEWLYGLEDKARMDLIAYEEGYDDWAHLFSWYRIEYPQKRFGDYYCYFQGMLIRFNQING